jgi:hypothetical protein
MNIGIVGAGIAGLHLGLFLQKHGVDATLYSDRSPDQIRAGRLPNLVSRFAPTRDREYALGVDHWEYPDFAVFNVQMHVGIEPPIVWRGAFKRPASSVDERNPATAAHTCHGIVRGRRAIPIGRRRISG